MTPRHSADYKSMLWALAMPIVALAQYLRPGLIPVLCPVSCYLALCAGVMAHNHNHCPTFASRRMNGFWGHWLSLFYGYPTFAWIPTHNMNHHKFVNRAGDATITWRHNNNHGFLTAFTYFFVSSYWQSEPIKDFIRKAKTHNRKLYRNILFQYGLWGSAAVATLALGIGLHGFPKGLGVWFAATGGPAIFALWTIMLFNYEQHVHADPWSEHSHSRSWQGWMTNFLLFNNGYHAAHHENPGTHWSKLPQAHAAIVGQIDPRLVENGFAWYFVKCYLLAPIFPRFRTHQVGRAPFETQQGQPIDLTTADVALAQAGETAAMV